MDEVKINTSKTLTLTLPSDPLSNIVSVSLYHEFGDLVSGPTNANRIDTGKYSITFGQKASGVYTLNSAGRHRADFTYTISGQSYTQSQYINVYTPYTTPDSFFQTYPELQTDFGTIFEAIERRTRAIINTFCGQSFEYYPDKSITIDGSGRPSLRLPYPIYTLQKVTEDPGYDYQQILYDNTDPTSYAIERIRQPFNFESTYYIRFKNETVQNVTVNEKVYSYNKFKSKSTYKIEGDFGWGHVPFNIQEASKILIADQLNDDAQYRKHGYTSIDLDVVKLQTKSSFYESTGNIDADVLLMDYTMFIMDYIG